MIRRARRATWALAAVTKAFSRDWGVTFALARIVTEVLSDYGACLGTSADRRVFFCIWAGYFTRHSTYCTYCHLLTPMHVSFTIYNVLHCHAFICIVTTRMKKADIDV